MPAQEQQSQAAAQQMQTQAPMAARVSSEQPRPVEQMTAEPTSIRGGGEGGCCAGLCAGLCCFECLECCC